MNKCTHADGGFLQPQDAWDALSMREKAEMMKVAVKRGIYNLQDIRTKYNEFAEGGNTDDDLVDWIIREEGFIANPRNIGDGKMTLGSGLTAKKWHDQYKRNGNKWTSSDNRRAVREEVANRRRWAERNIPNWDSLPSSSQKALLSYKYNYDFNQTNSPKLFKALADSNLQEAARQMNATSSNPIFRKGLQDRRQREQEWFLKDVTASPQVPGTFYQPAVSTQVYNPYVQQVENTRIAPIMVPDEDSYVTAHRLTEAEEKRQKFQERMETISNFNRLLQMTSLDNTAVPSFMPTTGNTFLDSMMGLTKAEGGSIQIKPSHRGRLTELKERTGKTEAELYNDGNPAHKKMVVFARNARKWKHGNGGNLFAPGGEITYGRPYYSYDENGRKVDDTLNYNATLPEIIITPDSKKSPAERAILERERRRNNDAYYGRGTYNAKVDREQTELEKIASQKAWENSTEKRALDYAQAAASGIGIGADIVSGLPIYSSLKGARVLGEAETPMDYAEGALWLTPIAGVAGREAWNTGKQVAGKVAEAARPIIENEGVAITNPFTGDINWIGKGLGSYIEVSPTSDGWLGVDYINSTRSGTGRKLYDAAIEEAHKRGLKGVKSGESLLSAPKTYNIWEHYPDKVHLGDYGSHGNSSMIDAAMTTKVNSPEELIEATKQGINAAIMKKAPVYGLITPSNNVPFLSFSRTPRAPQITAENATSITPEQWTAAQDAAIARGDMAEAQRLRDLHFKISASNTKVVDVAGNPQLVIHKTPNDFTVFDNSRSIGKLNWAATPKAFGAENGVFATGAGTNPKEMRLYVNMKNPHYPTIDEGMEPAFIEEGEDGILGIVDKDMTDFYKSASDAGEGFHMSLGVDNPYALKSANAVTYDNNGVRIPLGKRDNFKLNDIRYGLIPFGIGLTGYGLFNNQEALGGRTKKRKR